MSEESPFGTIPPVVGALALAIIGVEIVLSLADRALVGGATGPGWRLFALEDVALFQAHLDRLAARGALPLGDLARFVGFSFVHAGFTHAAMACVFVLALGKFVGEALSQAATLACFVAPAILGALAWWALTDDPVPLFGAFPGAYGLIGAFTFVLYAGLSRRGARRVQAFRLIGVLLAIQLVFLGAFGGGLAIVAELAAFVAGFLLAPVVAPGGPSAMLDRMRRR